MLPYYNCQEHPAQQYSNICIHSHKCNIKLCSDCVFNHKGIRKEMLLPEAAFKQRILTIIQESEKSNSQIYFQQQREEITKFFKVIEQQLQQTIQKLKQEAENVINIFEQEAKYLDSLKNELKDKSIFDFPNQQISRMAQLINSKQLPINFEMRSRIFYEISENRKQMKQTVEKMIKELINSSNYIKLKVGEDKIIEESNYSLWLLSKKTFWQQVGDAFQKSDEI